MNNDVWIIGSALDCDLIVRQPAVSARHCRLSRFGLGYVIEDLGSTNGTRVNGVLVQGQQPVAQTDRVTLGKRVVMPWPLEQTVIESRVVRIGRAADNDVVLDYPNVSAVHARIIIEGETLIIEDLGSTNGTAISSPDRRITRAPLSPEDTVYFGSTAVSVSELIPSRAATALGMVQPVNRKVPLAARASELWRRLRHEPRLMNGVAGLTAFVLVVAIIMLFRHGGEKAAPMIAGGVPLTTPSAPSPASSPVPSLGTAVTSAEVRRETKAAAEPDAASPTKAGTGTSPVPPQLTAGAEASSDGPPAAATTDVTAALFSILVSTPDDRECYRLGTAWAAQEHLLITSASTVVAIRRLQAEYPRATVRQAGSRRPFSIVRCQAHPEYEQARKSAEEARQKYEAALQQGLPAGANEEAEMQWRDKLTEYFHEHFAASERQVHYDLGSLEIAESLPCRLPLASGENHLRPKVKVHLRGIAFDREDPLFDATNPLTLSSEEGRVHRLAGLSESPQRAFRLLVEAGQTPLDLNWTGSPVMDVQGRVVAVFARPTPAVDPSQPPSGDLYDAALVTTLSGFVTIQ